MPKAPSQSHLRIFDILRLDHDEIRPVYRQLVALRRVYHRLTKQPNPPTPRKLQEKYRAALTALDALEFELAGLYEYESMRALCGRNVSAALRPGRPRTFALPWLIGELRTIYETRARTRATCYRDDINNQYRGNFFILCQTVAKEPLNGKAVIRVLKRYGDKIPLKTG